MRTLLIDPFYNSGVVPPNWSLGIIEQNLIDNGLEVSVVDFISPESEGMDYSFFKEQETIFIKSIINKLGTIDIVYITSSFGNPLKQKPVFPRIVNICENIKNFNRNIKIVVGGNNINYATKALDIECQNLPNMDLIDKFIVGDEIGFIEYAFEVFGIKKLSIISDAKLIKWSSWDFTKYPKYLSLLTAKGCIYNCSFCFEKKIFNKKYEKIMISSVIATIKYHLEKNGINKFAIEDSTFLSNKDLENFCNQINSIGKKIHWSAYGRIDEILRKRNELKKLYDSGCTNLIIGIETLKNDTLDIVNKNCTSNDALEAISLLKENGIGIQGCFVLGLPGDSYEDIRKNIEYGLSLKLTTYHWHVYQPNLLDTTQKYFGGRHPQVTDYLELQTNFPDSCIPEILSSTDDPSMLLMEEHFLIRSIPYLSGDENEMLGYGYNGLFFGEIFKIIKIGLFGKAKTFNEEEMYSII